MKRVILVGGMLSMLVPALALAHGGHEHLKGTLKVVTQTSLTVTTNEGKDVQLALLESTRVEKAGKPAARTELQVGRRVVVQTMEGDKGSMHAMLIKIADKTPAGTAPTSSTQGRSPHVQLRQPAGAR